MGHFVTMLPTSYIHTLWRIELQCHVPFILAFIDNVTALLSFSCLSLSSSLKTRAFLILQLVRVWCTFLWLIASSMLQYCNTIYPHNVMYLVVCIHVTAAEDELVDEVDHRAGSQERCVYTDICDGRLYKQFQSSGILGDSCRQYVSLTFNTDGIPVFRSSGYQFWPLYLVINELPFRLR